MFQARLRQAAFATSMKAVRIAGLQTPAWVRAMRIDDTPNVLTKRALKRRAAISGHPQVRPAVFIPRDKPALEARVLDQLGPGIVDLDVCGETSVHIGLRIEATGSTGAAIELHGGHHTRSDRRERSRPLRLRGRAAGFTGKHTARGRTSVPKLGKKNGVRLRVRLPLPASTSHSNKGPEPSRKRSPH